MVTNAQLHYALIKRIIDQGFAPSNPELAESLGVTEGEIEAGLYQLQEYHGVVLHPHAPQIWVIHPFSLSPTNFYVESRSGAWWGNCAWCSLGVAALIGEDCTIRTTLGAEGKPLTLHIGDGEIQGTNHFIHFPIPMQNAWDNVIYTCANMLVFESATQVDDWCARHRIPRGDLKPITKIWAFSKQWYGNHLNPEWEKWTMEEAKNMFVKFGLTDPIWQLEDSGERF